MMARLTYLSLLLALLLPDVLMAGAKIEFWDQQRKGANCFNVEPTEQWFAAAHALGIEWVRLTYSKWKGQQRDFLMGNADQFAGLVQQDLNRLIQVLDWADKHEIKVVLTPLGLPGCRWRQNNNMRPDLRLWQDKTYWDQAAQFWHELATQLKDHPAIYAYNIINEPTPEKGTGLAEDGPAERYLAWYRKYKGTSHDLPAFYKTMIQAIRQTDTETPIMLDSGWYGQAAAFVHWPRVKDEKILYSFHMHEPYQFTPEQDSSVELGLGDPSVVPNVWQPSPGHRQVPIWPGAAPDAKSVPEPESVETWQQAGAFGDKPVTVVSNVSQPTMTVYAPRGKNTGAAVVVLPGGGFKVLAMDLEGTEVCEWLTSQGITGVLLKYRVPGSGPQFDWARKRFIDPKPLLALQDAQRTLGLLRLNAAELLETWLQTIGVTADDPELCRLIEALSSDAWRERERAVETLGAMGLKARSAIGRLSERLADEQWHVRKAAASALSRMGAAAEPAIPPLIMALTDEEWQVRKSAAEALAAIGPDAYPAVPQLMESLTDWEWQVRSPAAQALASIGPQAKPAVRQLVSVLTDEEWKVRKHAAQALGAISVSNESVLSALKVAVRDEEEQVREAATQALNKLTDDKVH